MYEAYFLQNWLPRWNQILTQLRFIHNWVIRGIQWMMVHLEFYSTIDFCEWLQRFLVIVKLHQSVVTRASPTVLSMWLQTVTFNEKRSKCVSLAQEIGFSAPNSYTLPWLVKGQNSCAPPQKRVINWTWLGLSISDWSLIMLGPGGLLLVVPTYVGFQLQFYWWGCKKRELNLDI
jgi:hypothetical protein